MFGEHGFHLDGKFVAVACDDSLFVKPADALADLDPPMRTPWDEPY